MKFKKGDIEIRIQVKDNSIDLVISNNFVNFTTDKTKSFKKIKRILKPIFRMLVSDMVADRILQKEAINLEKWSGCIDGELPKDCIASIGKAGVKNVQLLNDQLYVQEEFNGMKNSNALIKVVED